MAYILLVRHGQNEWVKKHRLAGWTPGVHLNDKGHEQARAAAERLSNLPIKSVFSSPLERCRETAAAIAAPHSLEVEICEEVGEVRYGKWEGKKIKKLAKEKSWFAVQFFPSRFRFPEGEALREAQQRMVAALEQLNGRFQPHEMVVVCSHADLIKLALAHYLGVHIDLFQRIVIAPASLSVIALSPGAGVRVLRINDSGPLEAPRPPKKKKKDKKKRRSKEEDPASP